MLVIRLQRTGRAGRPMYRMVVQDSKTHPSKGRVVSFVGQFNPHTKELNIDRAAVEKFLANGAQPSPRVVRILTGEGVKMPKWVKKLDKKTAETRNKDKWRRFAPEEPKAESAPAEEAAPEAAPVAEAPAETPAEETATSETTPAE